jgi:D-3-phosphoglycerate dehydrogenase / 2-oxoglutarate reductase
VERGRRHSSRAMKKLLVLDSLFDSLAVEEAVAGALGWSLERWTGDERQLAEANAAVHVRTPIGKALVEKMPRCRVVGRFGTGLDTVDREVAHEAGIAVVNVRDYCIPELASHTVALALCLERRLNELARSSTASLDLNWQSFAAQSPIRGRTTATVVGFGSVGSAVAAALTAIGYDVLAVTQHGRTAAERSAIDVVDLEEGLARSSVVSLHTRFDPTSPKLIEREALEKMQPDAILVNTARLGLIDEEAVADAIASGRLGGLGLDAHLGSASPLRRIASHPRVFITPHIGWYSERSAKQLREETITATIGAYGSADDLASGARR